MSLKIPEQSETVLYSSSSHRWLRNTKTVPNKFVSFLLVPEVSLLKIVSTFVSTFPSIASKNKNKFILFREIFIKIHLMLPDQYKTFHESFMKNNNGSTAFDIFLYIVPSSFAIFHTITLTGLLKICSNNIPIRFLVEFMMMCVSLVFYTTVLSDIIGQIVITLFLITVTTAVKQLQAKFHLTPFVQIPSAHPDFITVARSVISLITAVCILAVDFQCFPRKLAKTEKFGFGGWFWKKIQKRSSWNESFSIYFKVLWMLELDCLSSATELS